MVTVTHLFIKMSLPYPAIPLFFGPSKQPFHKTAEKRTLAATGLSGQNKWFIPLLNCSQKNRVLSALHITLREILAHGKPSQSGGRIVTGPLHHQLPAAFMPGKAKFMLFGSKQLHNLTAQAGQNLVVFNTHIDHPFFGKSVCHKNRLNQAAAVFGLPVKGKKKGIDR